MEECYMEKFGGYAQACSYHQRQARSKIWEKVRKPWMDIEEERKSIISKRKMEIVRRRLDERASRNQGEEAVNQPYVISCYYDPRWMPCSVLSKPKQKTTVKIGKISRDSPESSRLDASVEKGGIREGNGDGISSFAAQNSFCDSRSVFRRLGPSTKTIFNNDDDGRRHRIEFSFQNQGLDIGRRTTGVSRRLGYAEEKGFGSSLSSLSCSSGSSSSTKVRRSRETFEWKREGGTPSFNFKKRGWSPPEYSMSEEEEEQERRKKSRIARFGPVHGNSGGFRPVVIDGTGVAYAFGEDWGYFNCIGIQTCILKLEQMGLTDITVVIPTDKIQVPLGVYGVAILHNLKKNGRLVESTVPGNKYNSLEAVTYADRKILDLASKKGAVVISNKDFHNIIGENRKWEVVVNNRVIPFTNCAGHPNQIYFPVDPYGRWGKHLQEIIRFPFYVLK